MCVLTCSKQMTLNVRPVSLPQNGPVLETAAMNTKNLRVVVHSVVRLLFSVIFGHETVINPLLSHVVENVSRLMKNTGRSVL